MPDYKYDPEEKGAFHNYLTGVLRNKALCALDKRRRKLDIKGESPESVGDSLGLKRNAVNQIKKRMMDRLCDLVERLKTVC